jgi:ADP-ribose pyrophosphatase YjhB (NUDIX family)
VTDESRRLRPSRPVLGVGAVIGDDGSVVLVRRAHPPLQGEWSLPGGAVEPGEALAAAVRREVLEETGLVVDVGPLVDVIERVQHDEAGGIEYHFVVADYKCRRLGGTLVPGSDASDARWVDPASLADFRVTDTAMAVVRKALAMDWPAPSMGHTRVLPEDPTA